MMPFRRHSRPEGMYSVRPGAAVAKRERGSLEFVFRRSNFPRQVACCDTVAGRAGRCGQRRLSGVTVIRLAPHVAVRRVSRVSAGCRSHCAVLHVIRKQQFEKEEPHVGGAACPSLPSSTCGRSHLQGRRCVGSFCCGNFICLFVY